DLYQSAGGSRDLKRERGPKTLPIRAGLFWSLDHVHRLDEPDSEAREEQSRSAVAPGTGGDLLVGLVAIDGDHEGSFEWPAVIEKANWKLAGLGRKLLGDELQSQSDGPIESGSGLAPREDEGFRAARVNLFAWLLRPAALGARLGDALETLVDQVLLEFLRLELDCRAAAAVGDDREARSLDAGESRRIGAGEPWNR